MPDDFSSIITIEIELGHQLALDPETVEAVVSKAIALRAAQGSLPQDAPWTIKRVGSWRIDDGIVAAA